MLKVVKFGGSSLASGEQFAKVKDIVESDSARRVVVVSAPGKRFKEDNKVTDLLYICHAHLKYNASCDDIWEKIEDRYREIIASCGLHLDIEPFFAEIRANLKKRTSADYIASRGEYLNALLMADYLGYTFVDAASWLHFRYDGKVDFEQSYAALREIASKCEGMVIPGFYGVMPDGSIKTFSRGGSDVTGAIAAAALDADSYENWTDVSGMLMADPRIVDNPKPIERITFAEMRELSCMGADVLHAETVFPVRQKNIPLYIKNTNDKNAPGTLIMEHYEDDDRGSFITGISGKKHFTILTVSKTLMSEQVGFIRRTLEIVERHDLTVEHIPSSVDSFSLVIESKQLTNCLHALISEIEQECRPDRITVTEGISLIAVVGRRMAMNIGVSGKIFETLGQHGINIRMIEQGADEINIIFGVEDGDFNRAIRALYETLTA